MKAIDQAPPGYELESLLANCTVSYGIWPHYECRDGERLQTGFEIELIGSHSAEARHIAPSCPTCHLVQAALTATADEVVRNLQITSGDSVAYEIYSRPNSVMCWPRLGNRTFVAVTIGIVHKSDYFQPVDSTQSRALSDIRFRLEKLGIPQR